MEQTAQYDHIRSTNKADAKRAPTALADSVSA
jgi:hypothetical protein